MANALVSFACAMQVQTFRKVNGYAFASTMCIGNMRSGMDSLCSWVLNRNPAALKKSLYYWGHHPPVCAGRGPGQPDAGPLRRKGHLVLLPAAGRQLLPDVPERRCGRDQRRS